ncbi:NAD(P)/FAD-dependent oxidoreductase [Aetokthonos hydrillicola Thurmond2011]|jgi:pyruvate/2-oxoglutarate dehydrogenase complex dihydrolipoamide dehydrogenase (E3) component|uniref:NAD(P)/FAD-dependent oxidoreductase n=1 Tax=Aetokthonos hydrillicola Thurmond2011 TaxID=2712845 RepID=A0AAP5IBC2_9CYAN|nr:NAD(P)/FAD-dependent oxidoreductase [Aetokthonos hydrillicola]MBO3459217.1 NAD(P)/FAD-dependent oxidoreductase [Aetokthonos hydrillicola CCALA 1050]MBW4584176.1 NAD(P)/FAD-dependent oxidoreductase [Aetokthonos hydrillicola CCALA 1050]MDR9898291.1 NAD(P)/FAD-dependent oxidoreductase [Aetokthonos hydrillicola Thurmond2011]
MTVDYDVVIIGGSLAGRYAALTATQLKAKVALVEPDTSELLYSAHTPYELIYHQIFNEIANLTEQISEAAVFKPHALSVDISQANLYAHATVSNLQQQHSLAILAAKGVDVIVGGGEFQSSPRLSFATNSRVLRARNYLLATSVQFIPEIEGLQKTGFLTLSNIWQSLDSHTPPKNWAIIGGVPQSIELAQTLTRLGCSVTLIVDRPFILSHIDPEIAHLLRSHLEAEGVRVFTHTRVTQVRRIDDKKWLQAGDKAIETDEIVVATGQQPNIQSLNLAGVNVKWNQSRVLVNDKLQTTNHRIYACGDVIGGYDCPNIANYEAKIAVKNALFFPRFKVNYQSIPWGIFTRPMLAQVGLTEAQAKRLYSHDEVIVLQHYFKTMAAAQVTNQTTGVCKLITLPNGLILGATVFGGEARELINIIALAIAQKIQVKHLANLSSVYPSFSEILEQTAQDWNQRQFNSNVALQDFLQSFFLCRRNWDI